MTIYTRIVTTVLNRPRHFDAGFGGVVLDDSHTLVWCSDHSRAARARSESELDSFVADYDTVDSHSSESNAGAEISDPEGGNGVDTTPYPDKAKFNGEKLPTASVEAGRVIWDRI